MKKIVVVIFALLIALVATGAMAEGYSQDSNDVGYVVKDTKALAALAPNPIRVIAPEPVEVIRGGNTVDLSQYVKDAIGPVDWVISGETLGCRVAMHTGVFTSGDAQGEVIVSLAAWGDDTHEGSQKTIKVKVIAKKAQTLRFAETSVSKHYWDDPFTNAATLEVGDGTISYAVTAGADVATVNPVTGRVTLQKKQGTATITATAAETQTYQAGSASYTLKVDGISIEKAVVKLDHDEWRWEWGTNKRVKVTSVVLDGTTLNPGTDYTVGGVLTAYDVGYYTVTVTGIGKYSGTVSARWRIKGYTMSYLPGNASVTYDGKPHTIWVYSWVPSNKDIHITWGLSKDNITLADPPTITNVKEGPLTIYFRLTAQGFEPDIDSAVITITKAPSAVTAKPVARTDLVYTGEPQELVKAGAANGGTMYYAVTTEKTIPDDRAFRPEIARATDTGTYCVWYKVVGDDNHTDIAVDPAPIYVVMTSADKDALTTEIYAAENYHNNELRGHAEYSAVAAKLQSAIDAATAVKNNPNASPKQISDAAEALKQARATAEVEKVAADKKKADDLVVAKKVSDAIAALPEKAGEDDKAAVEAARASYDALTDDQKALVGDDMMKKLRDAEDAVKAAKKAADEAAAKAVADAIEALPADADADDQEAVEAARKAFDDLTDDQEALVAVDVVAKLTAAEQQVQAAEEAAKLVDISACRIAVKDRTYTGARIKKPSVTVEYGGRKLAEGTDYTISYNKKAKAVGTYKLTVSGIGQFTGEKQVTFRIIPKGTAFTDITGGKKQVTLSWKRRKNVTGYQIEYSLNKDFSGKKRTTILADRPRTRTIKHLKAGRKYYVRIRTYTKVGNKNYYSAWSEVEKVKTKGGKAKNASTEAPVEVTLLDFEGGDVTLEIDGGLDQKPAAGDTPVEIEEPAA